MTSTPLPLTFSDMPIIAVVLYDFSFSSSYIVYHGKYFVLFSYIVKNTLRRDTIDYNIIINTKIIIICMVEDNVARHDSRVTQIILVYVMIHIVDPDHTRCASSILIVLFVVKKNQIFYIIQNQKFENFRWTHNRRYSRVSVLRWFLRVHCCAALAQSSPPSFVRIRSI